MEATLRNMCASEVPGDTYRNLRINPVYSKKTFKYILNLMHPKDTLQMPNGATQSERARSARSTSACPT